VIWLIVLIFWTINGDDEDQRVTSVFSSRSTASEHEALGPLNLTIDRGLWPLSHLLQQSHGGVQCSPPLSFLLNLRMRFSQFYCTWFSRTPSPFFHTKEPRDFEETLPPTFQGSEGLEKSLV